MASKYHCGNCRENRTEDNIKKIAIGEGRSVVFCGECNCYVKLEETAPAPTAPAPSAKQPGS